MHLDKDTYEYILNFLDDKDIVNMLSVNRKFNNEKIYERVLRRKYPLLLKFKGNNETWRHFFLRMGKYICYINQKYNIPYIPLQDYDPEDFYKSFQRDYTDTLKIIATMLLREKAENKHTFLFILQKLQEKIKDSYYFIFALHTLSERAIEAGNIEKLKILLEKGAQDYHSFFLIASRKGQLEILEFLTDKVTIPIVIHRAISLARRAKHKEVITYLSTFV